MVVIVACAAAALWLFHTATSYATFKTFDAYSGQSNSQFASIRYAVTEEDEEAVTPDFVLFYDVDATILVRDCSKPVRVEADFRLGTQLPAVATEQATVVEVPHNSVVFVSDPGRHLRNFEALVPAATVLRSYEKDGEVPNEVTWRPLGVDVTTLDPPSRFAASLVVPRWLIAKSSLAPPTLRVRFDAGWASPRSSGTCYIRLPDLIRARTELGALQPRRGSVTVRGQGAAAGYVLSGDSVPEPDDPRQPRWDCESTAANTVKSQAARCDGYAVFTKRGVHKLGRT